MTAALWVIAGCQIAIVIILIKILQRNQYSKEVTAVAEELKRSVDGLQSDVDAHKKV